MLKRLSFFDVDKIYELLIDFQSRIKVYKSNEFYVFKKRLKLTLFREKFDGKNLKF